MYLNSLLLSTPVIKCVPLHLGGPLIIRMSAYFSTSSVQYAADMAITRKPFSLGNYRKLVCSFWLVSYKLILSCAGPCGV